LVIRDIAFSSRLISMPWKFNDMVRISHDSEKKLQIFFVKGTHETGF
jgi:hypothetical protein